MGREPALHSVDVIRIQHVDHHAAFEVDDNRAVIQPFALGPFINADDARVDDPWARPLLEPPHNRVVTHRQATTTQEPFPARPPSAWPINSVTASARLVRRP